MLRHSGNGWWMLNTGNQFNKKIMHFGTSSKSFFTFSYGFRAGCRYVGKTFVNFIWLDGMTTPGSKGQYEVYEEWKFNDYRKDWRAMTLLYITRRENELGLITASCFTRCKCATIHFQVVTCLCFHNSLESWFYNPRLWADNSWREVIWR